VGDDDDDDDDDQNQNALQHLPQLLPDGALSELAASLKERYYINTVLVSRYKYQREHQFLEN
jgi:hypothetical protein